MNAVAPSQSDGSVLPSSWSDSRLNFCPLLTETCRVGASLLLGTRKLCERETEISNCFWTSSSLPEELEESSSP